MYTSCQERSHSSYLALCMQGLADDAAPFHSPYGCAAQLQFNLSLLQEASQEAWTGAGDALPYARMKQQ